MITRSTVILAVLYLGVLSSSSKGAYASTAEPTDDPTYGPTIIDDYTSPPEEPTCNVNEILNVCGSETNCECDTDCSLTLSNIESIGACEGLRDTPNDWYECLLGQGWHYNYNMDDNVVMQDAWTCVWEYRDACGFEDLEDYHYDCGGYNTIYPTDGDPTPGPSIIVDPCEGIADDCCGDDCPIACAKIPGTCGDCFSAKGMMDVLGKGQTMMKDVHIGDKVRVSTTAGVQKYETVYGFGHFQPNIKAEFLKIDDSLEVTSNHLVYVVDDAQGVKKAIRADQVQEGDMILTDNETTKTVSKISTIRSAGKYMPLTPSGDLVVNGILASAYVSISAEASAIVHHPLLKPWMSERTMLHLWLAPYRMVCLGISSNLCDTNNPNAYNEHGIHKWLWTGMEMACYANDKSIFIQVPMGLAVFGILLVLYAVELVFGSALSPSVLVGASVYLVRSWKQHRSFLNGNTNIKSV